MENVNMEKVAEKKTKKHQNFTNRLQFTFTVTQRGGNTMPMQKIVFSQNTRDIKVLIK